MRGAKFFLIAVLLAAMLAAAVPATAGASASSREMRRTLLTLTNAARRNNGLRPLDINWRLSEGAARHSRRMAANNSLFHTPNLYKLVKRWHPSMWGENVASSGTVRRAHKMFMRSAPHRANVLKSGYENVGIGVISKRGRVWTTVMFYGG